MKTIDTISCDSFARVLPTLNPNRIIDVRSAAEYSQEGLPGSINIPLDTFNEHQLRLNNQGPDQTESTIYLLCKSGQRSKLAANKLPPTSTQRLCIIEGGINELKQFGVVKKGAGKTISLERQVFIAAGTLILTGLLLAAAGFAWGAWLSAFVGAGLLFAGLTGYCGMALILAKAPWNKG